MTRRTLIVGYGSAGKRHARDLAEIGEHSVYASDINPETGAQYGLLSEALEAVQPTHVIIATPPVLHLEQIAEALTTPSVERILCEKPLCSIGQYTGLLALSKYADMIMPAYNYRWNVGLHSHSIEDGPMSGSMFLTAGQSRVLPPWGILLDHASHDLDIVRFISGGIKNIRHAELYIDGAETRISIVGGLANGKEFTIRDAVFREQSSRQADITFLRPDMSVTTLPITAEHSMFTNMLRDFVNPEYPWVGWQFRYALETQYWLEVTALLLKTTKVSCTA